MSVPNLRNIRDLWTSAGGIVEDIRRTGEERFSHPRLERPVKVNKRRKDCPRKLLSALRAIEAQTPSVLSRKYP